MNILFDADPDASIHKILNKIADDHSDLEKQGFSKSNLYKYVQISKYAYKLQKNRFSREKSKFPERVTEQSSAEASQEREQIETEAKKLAELHSINLEEQQENPSTRMSLTVST